MAVGKAHAAVTILNGLGGQGCALPVRGGVEATWTASATPRISTPGSDEALVQVAMAASAPGPSAPARVVTTSTFPPARGLKTSSSAAAALVRARAAHHGVPLDDASVIEHAVAWCRAAGVTLTGALDDQVAVVRGRAVLTDTKSGSIVSEVATKRWHVAIWVPTWSIPKQALRGIDLHSVAHEVGAAQAALADGDIPGAMTLNGAAVTTALMRHGVRVDTTAAKAALDGGALGAGLSGTGPAVAALFDDPLRLPVVPGGTWHWTEAL